MLNIEILKLEDNKAEVRAWIPKRHVNAEPMLYYNSDEIKSAIEESLAKKDKNILSCEFLTDVTKLMNKLASHKKEQVVLIKLRKKKEEKKAKVKKEAKNSKS